MAENTTIALHQSAAAATGAGAGAAPVKPTGPLGIAVTAPHATVQPPTTAAPPPVSVRQTADGYPLRATGELTVQQCSRTFATVEGCLPCSEQVVALSWNTKCMKSSLCALTAAINSLYTWDTTHEGPLTKLCCSHFATVHMHSHCRCRCSASDLWSWQH